MQRYQTTVAIVGAGPSGLLLSQLLANDGIDSIIVERTSAERVLARIRAGLLEQGSVETLEEADVGARCRAEGLPHEGMNLMFNGELCRIDLLALTGRHCVVYGQTELTRDLLDRRQAEEQTLFWSTSNVQLHALDSSEPSITFTDETGNACVIEADIIAGCDGFHGVCRPSIPDNVRREFERVYPFGWLGMLLDQPPLHHELIYANSAKGFALASMRSATRSRYYIQCDADDSLDNWTADRFFDALSEQLGPEWGSSISRGEPIEMSIAPLRSFVVEPMQYGRLFLVGDAAHIVPPTGAKGLNLAIADVRRLARAVALWKLSRDQTALTHYAVEALSRVWKVERFSWHLSMMLHQFPGHTDFDRRMQYAEFDYIRSSEAAASALAENYVGLPY